MPTINYPTSDINWKALFSTIGNKNSAIPVGQPRPLSDSFATNISDKKDDLGGDIVTRDQTKEAQLGATRLMDALELKGAKMLKHYWSSIRWAIRRGEEPPEIWARLEGNMAHLRFPKIESLADMKRLIDLVIAVENERRTAEKPPISFPDITDFEAIKTELTAQMAAHTAAKDAYDAAQDALENLRREIKEIGKAAYRTIYVFFKNQGFSDPDVRRKMREWGFTYRTLPGEPPEEE